MLSAHWASECIIQQKLLLMWFWQQDLIGAAIGVVLGQQKDISKDL